MHIQNSGALEGQQQQKQGTTAEMEWHKQWGRAAAGAAAATAVGAEQQRKQPAVLLVPFSLC